MGENTSNTYVVDASYILAHLLEKDKRVHEMFEDNKRLKKLIAPHLLFFEVGNGLRSAVLRQRISEKTARELIVQFLKLDIKLREVNFLKALEMSIKYNLSFYDGVYITLAKELRVSLATFDNKLKKVVW